ncbi:MAG: HlyD family efflux transporter periplasmic adaptor subunit [Kofleriaceae bacterium]|nr:HlyD family efflux transporter periplasmic adaptor subunit [Kofleriaceae bacterium]
MKKWIRRIVLLVALVAAGVAVYLALAPRAVGVEVALIAAGDLRITVDELGRTRVQDRYSISAPLAGQLARVELRPGDAVTTDTVVARILPAESPLFDARTKAELGTRVNIARAALSQAKAGTERAAAAEAFSRKQRDEVVSLAASAAISGHERELAELEFASRQKERESAEFAVRALAHQLTLAEISVARTVRGPGASEELVIRSPLVGQVLRVMQPSAGVVLPGSAILELGDPNALEVVVDVLTSDAVGVAPGMSVAIENWGGAPLTGRVRRVEPSAFTKISALGVEEQRVTVIIDPVGPAGWKGLGDGWRVEARIEVASRIGVLLVPVSAVVYDGGRPVVYVVRDGKAHRVQVGLGRQAARDAEVLSGLGVGDRVIIHPSDRVVDGIKVTIRGT